MERLTRFCLRKAKRIVAVSTEIKSKMISDLNRIMPGGIIYKTDSLANFIKYQNNLQKISKINLFTSVILFT